jgi:hypothetical protein
MVNRNSSFNRRKVNKLKTIRDRKRGEAKNKGHYNLKCEEPTEKQARKQERRQKKIAKIHSELNVKPNEFSKKIKRRNDRKKNRNNKDDEMQVE